MGNLWLTNLAAYCLQTMILLAAGGLTLKLLRLRIPHWRLLCWQVLLAACVLLPLGQSWRRVAEGSTEGVTFRTVVVGNKQHSNTGMRLTWTGALGCLLLAGTAVRLGLFGLGFVRLNAYRRRSRPETDIARGLRDRLQVDATIQSSEEIPGPVTFGLFRPVILLPARWVENDAVLYHELIHVRRRDWSFMAIEELIRAVLWFHPLVWWAIAQIQLAREEVVDREVIQLTQSREQYLETLLAIAAARSGLDLAPAPLFLRKRHLRSRVASLMKEGKMSRIRLHSSLAGFLALTLVAGWLAVRAFPLQAAQESSQDGAKTRPIAVEVMVQDKLIKVSVEIDKDGNVLKVNATSGAEELRQTAVDAVRQWHFTQKDSGRIEVETKGDSNVTLKAVVRQDEMGPKRIRVGGNVQAANLVKKVTPIYPPAAKEARIQGTVRLNVVIGADGKVEDVQIEEGDPLLADAAVPAVRQWVYRPVLLNGDPVSVITQVDVNFTLSQ